MAAVDGSHTHASPVCPPPQAPEMDFNWPVLLSMAVFYLAVLGIGLWASGKARREEKKCTGNISEVTMVGGRNLNLFVSIFTMTATWVGGGYIVGCAEVVYNPRKGLVWALGPIAFAANLILGECERSLIFIHHWCLCIKIRS